MQNTNRTAEQFYSENEAAEYLGISVERLHQLLDRNIFNDGSSRPAHLTFTNAELLVLGFWNQLEGNDKVIRMPRRL